MHLLEPVLLAEDLQAELQAARLSAVFTAKSSMVLESRADGTLTIRRQADEVESH